MKRLAVVLLVLALALCGCAKGETVISFPELPEGAEVWDAAFTCQNYDYDVYPEVVGEGMVFFILSRDHVEPEEISVSIPVDWHYEALVSELECPRRLTEYAMEERENGDEIPYVLDSSNADFYAFLYQTYRGMDWQALGSQAEVLNDLRSQAEAAAPEDGEELNQVYENALMDYEKASTAYIRDYMKLEKDSLPKFYLYEVQITFSAQGHEDTSFESIEIHMGKETFPVEIGEIRLCGGALPNSYSDDLALLPYLGGPHGLPTVPYCPGITGFQTEAFRIQEDLTLTGFSPAAGTDSTAEIVDITVRLSEDEWFNDMPMELKWDGKAPITVPKGKYMTMDLVVKDDRMSQPDYGGILYATLEYTHGGESYTHSFGCNLTRMCQEPWVLYVQELDGIDLQAYYQYYHETMDTRWKDYVS